MPPEFIDQGKITKKFDVFSLGVIIIQIIAGIDGYRQCCDMSSTQEFVDYVRNFFYVYTIETNIHFKHFVIHSVSALIFYERV